MCAEKNQNLRRKRKKIQKTVFWILLLSFTLMVGLVFWAPVTSNPYVKALLEKEVSDMVGAPVTFERMDLDFFPPSVRIEEIRLHNPLHNIKKLDVYAVDVVVQLRSLFLGKLVVSYAEIVKPDIELVIQTQTKQKKEGLRPGSFFEKDTPIVVQDLQIKDARIKVSGPNQISFTLLPKDISFRQEGYSEMLSLKGRGVLTKEDSEIAIDNVLLDLVRFQNQIFVQKFEIADQNNTIISEGLVYPTADFSIAYSGNLEKIHKVLVDLHLLKEDVSFSGNVLVESNLKGEFTELHGTHSIELKDTNIGSREIELLKVKAKTKNEFIEDVVVDVKHHESQLKVTLAGNGSNHDLTYRIQSSRMSFVDIQYWINPDKDPVLFSDVKIDSTGKLSLSPFSMKGDLEVLFPTVTFDIPPNVNEFLPIQIDQAVAQCDFLWDNKNGIQFAQGHLIHPQMDAKFFIHIGMNGEGVDGEWDIQMGNIAAIFQDSYPVKGAGKVIGSVKENKTESNLTFNFDLKNFEYENFGDHHFKGILSFVEDGVLFEEFSMSNKEGGKLSFEGETSATSDSFDIRSKFSDFEMAWVGRIIQRRYPYFNQLKGLGKGDVILQGKGDDVNGDIRLHMGEAFAFDVPIEKLDTRFDFQNQDILIRQLEIKGKTLKASAEGTLTREGFRQVKIHVEKLPLDFFELPTFVTSYVDTLDANTMLEGDFENPQINFEGDLFFQQDLALEPFQNRAKAYANGKIENLNWKFTTIDPGMNFQGLYRGGDDPSVSFKGAWQSFPIFSFLQNAQSSITGAVQGSGKISSFSSWNVIASLEEVKVENEQVQFYNKSPFDISIENGQAHFQDLRFGNKTHEVLIQGDIDQGQRIDISLTGALPFETLSVLPLDLVRVEGILNLNLRLGGLLQKPILQGNVRLQNGYLRHKIFPHPFESIEMQADIDQNQLHANYFEAKLGGGTVIAEGDLFLSSKVEQMRLYMTGDINQANIRFPEYLPVVIQGPFSVEGALTKPLLKTDFEVISGMYTDDWDWQSQFLTFGDEKEAERIYLEEEESLLLDMHFYSTNENFLVRNDVAIAKVKGDLYLRGSNKKFGLLGTVEIIEGQVTFLENEFDLLPGVVSFIRDDEIALSFNLNARTRVGNTDILLDIRTEQEVIRAYLSSIPQKEETTIISLLTLGVELDDLAVSSGVNEGVSASLIPSVLSGPVQTRLQSGLKKIRLVDSFQFIPYFSEDTKTTGLKLFVAKNLFSKVRLTYSTDLFDAGNENTFTLEQFLNDKVSVQGSFRDNKVEADQDVDLGLDFEFRLEF